MRLFGWKVGANTRRSLLSWVMTWLRLVRSQPRFRRSLLDRLPTLITFLSDSDLSLTEHLALPTVIRAGRGRVYEPLTLLVDDGRVSWVFYPLEHPRFDAAIATEWVRRHTCILVKFRLFWRCQVGDP